MELHEAVAAYRERIKYVLSRKNPPPTDEWLEAEAERLTTTGVRDANGHSGNGASAEADGAT